MWTLVVETFEPSHRYAIVEHRFRGETQEEADSYYQAHMRSDRFLRECIERGQFDGRVQCRNKVKWVRT